MAKNQQTVLARKHLLAVLVTLTALFAVVSNSALRADEVKHKQNVNITKVNVIRGAKSATRNTTTIELTFALNPSVPKGTMIVFDLRYQIDPDELDSIRYTLESQKRSGLSLTWKPKNRLPVGDYSIKTMIPLAIQTQAVARAIKKKEKVFPADSAPWTWYHFGDEPIKVGTPDDLKAEREEVKKYFRDNTASIQNSYNGFVDEIDKLQKGEKYVSGGAVQTKELVAFLDPWMKKYGALQKTLRGFERTNPGFFSKDRPAYLQLEVLGKQAAKCAWQKLKSTLRERKSSIGNLKYKGSNDFDNKYRGRVTESRLEQTYGAINRLIEFDVDESEPAKPAAPAEKPAAEKKPVGNDKPAKKGSAKKSAGKSTGEKP